MKKIIFYSDVHYSNKSPSCRKDDYPKSILSKLNQINKLCIENDCIMAISGGDITHAPNEAYSVFIDLHDYYANTRIKHFLVAGMTHDFRGNYEVGFNNSVLGALKKSGDVDEVGQTFTFEVEGVKFYTSHRTIVPTPFYGSYELFEDFKEDCHVVLLSHIHYPYGTSMVNGRYFVSPGSIARNASDSFNLNRRPRVAIISCEAGQVLDIEYVELDVELDVFDEKYLIKKDEDKLVQEPRSLEHLESLRSSNENIDCDDLIKQVYSSGNYKQESLERSLKIKKDVGE